MTSICLTVNGKAVSADVPPRLHLADFLRENLGLTGTHLGCEHGVCGACTVLIDDAPARSCIAFAAACNGASVRSIEGLQDDAVMVRLRAAFKAEHGLQCGYCTPGMLVTARDIVLRVPDADEARIRLELAGNLCRCTGYAGIVRAIASVLRAGGVPAAVPTPPIARAEPVVQAMPAAVSIAPAAEQTIEQSLRIELSRDAVWQSLLDPALIAGCVPGARLTSVEGDWISGTLLASLGPIRGEFSGRARVVYQEDGSGSVEGEGQDQASGTRLRATTRFVLRDDGPDASVLTLHTGYALRGPLAQLGRPAVVRALAAELGDMFARGLEARVAGRAAPARLGMMGLMGRLVRNWLRRVFGRSGR